MYACVVRETKNKVKYKEMKICKGISFLMLIIITIIIFSFLLESWLASIAGWRRCGRRGLGPVLAAGRVVGIGATGDQRRPAAAAGQHEMPHLADDCRSVVGLLQTGKQKHINSPPLRTEKRRKFDVQHQDEIRVRLQTKHTRFALTHALKVANDTGPLVSSYHPLAAQFPGNYQFPAGA